MDYSKEQWRWLARATYWARRLVMTVAPGVDGAGVNEVLMGTHTRPDGSRVSLFLSARIEPPGDPYARLRGEQVRTASNDD